MSTLLVRAMLAAPDENNAGENNVAAAPDENTVGENNVGGTC